MGITITMWFYIVLKEQSSLGCEILMDDKHQTSWSAFVKIKMQKNLYIQSWKRKLLFSLKLFH